MLFMPVYKLSELLVIGRRIRKFCEECGEGTLLGKETRAFVAEYYTDDHIRIRYQMFGGIIRRVLPSSYDQMAFVDKPLFYKKMSELDSDTALISFLTAAFKADHISNMDSFAVQWTPATIYREASDGEGKPIIHREFNFANCTSRLASAMAESLLTEKYERYLPMSTMKARLTAALSDSSAEMLAHSKLLES
jgi:hypothetical protein